MPLHDAWWYMMMLLDKITINHYHQHPYYLMNSWSFCRSIIIIDTLIIIWGALDLFADLFQSRIREFSSRQMTQCNSSVKQKVLKSFWIFFVFVFVAVFLFVVVFVVVLWFRKWLIALLCESKGVDVTPCLTYIHISVVCE